MSKISKIISFIIVITSLSGLVGLIFNISRLSGMPVSIIIEKTAAATGIICLAPGAAILIIFITGKFIAYFSDKHGY